MIIFESEYKNKEEILAYLNHIKEILMEEDSPFKQGDLAPEILTIVDIINQLSKC